MTPKQQIIMKGTDPEMFVTYTKEGEDYVLPPVFLRDSLGIMAEENGRHPIFLRDDGGGYLHEDGAALEICVPPSEDWEVLWDQCDNLAKKFSDTVLSELPSSIANSALSMLPTVKWEVDRWKDRGTSFAMATRFGCDPDDDAWEEFAPPEAVDKMDATLHPWRYAGGHMHFSLPGSTEIEKRPLDIVASLAFTAGLAAIAFGNNQELEQLRSFRYGKPTKHRVQHYSNGDVGIEYRTPSASWLGDKSLAAHVFGWAEVGIRSLFLEGNLEKVMRFKTDTANAIMTADKETALFLLDKIGKLA